jgi:murein L,D-transpeptidase YafK
MPMPAKKDNPFKVRPIYVALLLLSALFAFGVFHAGTIKVFFIAHRVRAELTPKLEERHLAWGSPVFIRIFKEEKQLELWLKGEKNFKLFTVYPVCSYSGGLGPKVVEGDKQAPEGFYSVTVPAMNPNSAFHLSFNIGFPNTQDRAKGWTGSFLMVHGACISVGCYAMTDAGIDNIYVLMRAAFDAGQEEIPLHIFPFRMTPENISLHKDSPWAGWWQELKPGYDSFEKSHNIPAISVRSGKYFVDVSATP